MQILGKLFNAFIFVSAIGSIFTVTALFVNHILRRALPLWFPLCGMLLFCFPFLSPDVFLIPPEEQDWLRGFRIASLLWACGCGAFLVRGFLRLLLAKQALKGCPYCAFADCRRTARFLHGEL